MRRLITVTKVNFRGNFHGFRKAQLMESFAFVCLFTGSYGKLMGNEQYYICHCFEVRHRKLDKSGNVIPSDIFDPQNIAAS